MVINKSVKLAAAAALMLFAPLTWGGTLFEGYYRIERGRKHVGYLVQRLVEDPKTSTKTLIGYLRTKQGDKEVFEAYKVQARSGSGQPLKSEYTISDSTGNVSVLGQFAAGGQGHVEFRDGTKRKLLKSEKLPPVALASSLLFYVTDFAALKKGADYRYYAYTEERGRIGTGTLRLIDEKNAGDQRVLHVVDDFLGQPVENFVGLSGYPLGSRLPADETVAYWVPEKADAVGLMQFPQKQIDALFGSTPKGDINPWTGITEFRPDILINSFGRSEGSRSISSEPKAKPAPLPLRKF